MDKRQPKKLKQEIIQLKRSLNELNDQKERWFSRKENLKKDISSLIGKVKSIKSSKDQSNESIQELKRQRDKYNKEVQESIKKFQELNKKKEKFMKEKKISFNPSDIIKKIEALEFKIETEGVSFEKEKTMMKQINHFKKQLTAAGDVQSTFKELKELSDKITETKQKAEEAHKKIRSSSSKSKGNYGEFIEITKKINSLRKEQEQAFKNFIDSKEKFAKVNEQLKEKLKHARTLGEEIVMSKKKETDKIIEKKTREVEEKLKTKKKLTTEDLMIFQKSENESNKSNHS
jgi:uncharacterized coiled-coil DUF342 family protein